ncbi:hypothetical protein F2Q70_00043587 [Brassica cretica]|uniref:Uncharacterized protein n=1 Tax=Brassica cretica TaxID=69181 RepID=A0A8S9KHF5_BRACR|nr:hypothetical protein F2Q70_00043587 [Brassica cretica]
MERIDRGEDPLFTRLTDSQAFGYSNMIWGLNQGEVAANGGGTEKAPGDTQEDEPLDNAGRENAFRENGRVSNDEPVNENGAEKALCSEEVNLKIKKLRFTVKLVEAANDG